MITLHPGHDLDHCHECGLRWRMDETRAPLVFDALTGAYFHRCPLHGACAFCDRIEQECDLTGVMQMVQVMGEPDAQPPRLVRVGLPTCWLEGWSRVCHAMVQCSPAYVRPVHEGV